MPNNRNDDGKKKREPILNVPLGDVLFWCAVAGVFLLLASFMSGGEANLRPLR